MSSDLTLKIENLTKVYELYGRESQKLLGALFPYRFKGKKFTALKDFSLEVYRGECLGVMGVNGSGKSTLLQMIAGTLYPTSGTIFANGKIVSLLELGAWINADDSGRQNIYTAGYAQGLSREQIESHLNAIIDFAEIGDFIDQPMSTYSTGMMMRLAFATNINIEADILLLDEVFAVGDAHFVQKCMAFIREFIRDKTVLLVSHDPNVISSLCNRAVLLAGGELICDGNTLEVTERYLELCYGEMQDVIRNGAVPVEETRDDFRSQMESHPVCVSIFDPEGEQFGEGNARLEEVCIRDCNGNRQCHFNGGESIRLMVRAKALTGLQTPSIGFVLKDPSGQYLFGDTTLGQPIANRVAPGICFEAEFEFVLPRLQNGIYYIGAAVSIGTLDSHRVQVWNHRALKLQVNRGIPIKGCLLGIPMRAIKVRILE